MNTLFPKELIDAIQSDTIPRRSQVEAVAWHIWRDLNVGGRHRADLSQDPGTWQRILGIARQAVIGERDEASRSALVWSRMSPRKSGPD